MLFWSLLWLPFWLTEFLFVPEYWSPPSILNLVNHIGFWLESLLFGFFVWGIASVLYEILGNYKVIKIRSDYKTHILSYLVVIFIFLGSEIVSPQTSIYNLSFALISGAGIAYLFRKDLRKCIIYSGIFFAIIYFILFKFFDLLIPNYIMEIYNNRNLLWIYFWGIPLEELLFGFSVGACWSSYYEYIKGYSLKKILV